MILLFVLFSLLLATPGLAEPQAVPEPPAPPITLTYDRPLGQVALYRLSLAASGTEVSLDETIPVSWRAVVEIREEVIAKGADGAVWTRFQAQPVEIKDQAGTLGAGLPARWPVLQVRASRRGEILEIAPATGEPEANVRARSLVSLASQPPPVILPEAPVRVGETWEYDSGGVHQTSRLLALSEGDPVARLATTGSFLLALAECSEALGLTTQTQGEGKLRADTDLLVSQGVLMHQTGETRLLTKSTVNLKLPEGDTVYSMDSDITVRFDLRLVELDGQRVPDS